VDYARGLEAVEALRPLVPNGATMAEFALRWILMHPEVTCAIPGARNAEQVEGNVRALDVPALPPETMRAAGQVYDRYLREAVHPRW
jgi:aryl-alcohol dehydrogenase-like predicted oxidoreductase